MGRHRSLKKKNLHNHLHRGKGFSKAGKNHIESVSMRHSREPHKTEIEPSQGGEKGCILGAGEEGIQE